MSTSGPCTEFPAPGLRNPNRYITGHNEKGESVFLHSDHGDHHSVMLGGAAVQNILYSSGRNPIQLNGNADLEYIKKNPSLHIPHGVVVRMIDFAPGTESEFHRSICIVFGTVCEGELEYSLDGGESRRMRPGDVSVNRATMHKWRNVSSDKPARILYFLLDVEPVVVNGKTLEFEVGALMDEYAQYDGKK
ncbi:uncharacterized protein BCR38DRAFT_358122 [Pseudomassariella vexata]|uniref:Cupin type-2 domain-containing protein n=1 Tax=Pseudomassariella vexata TaxID=1141098 RepID=A0A1Y2EHZ6_9PEZI|nr:uncharacterized protein BCR38DRAFT_358122 [Pseudomassariella vexata]ORY71067.1 hypothetical protein BCR38DRAFT_358122 [Pseudomassariella vexata]